jgi:hypothetical protein
MIATVISADACGKVCAKVRRKHYAEQLDGSHHDLKKGDRVEVKRVTNNPYLVRVTEGGRA